MLNRYFQNVSVIFAMIPLILWLIAIYVSFNPIPTGEVRNETVAEMIISGNIIRQIAFLIGAFISLLMIIGKPIPKTFYMILLVFAIFFLSTLWSIAPEYTIKRSIRFLCLGLILLPLSISNQRFFQALKVILIFAIVICTVSLVMYFLGSGVTIMGGELRLQGLTPQPNALGPLALMGIILLFYLRKHRDVYFFGALAILIVTLFLTKSRATYIALFAFFAINFAIKGPNKSFLVKIGLVLLIVFITSAIGFFNVREFGGRDFTFTGRRFLWELTIQDWTEHPIWGAGYGASFVPITGSLFENILNQLDWATSHSHQEVLQLFNELGLIFAPIVLLILMMGIQHRSRIALYILAPLIVFVLVETVIFDGTIFSLMFFLLYLYRPDLKQETIEKSNIRIGKI